MPRITPKFVRLLVGFAAVAMPTTVLNATHTTQAAVDCASIGNVYQAPRATLVACGYHIIPLQAKQALGRGGTEYDYASNGSKTVYRVPPSGFDPLIATNDRLLYYDLPPRPEVGGQPLAFWKREMANLRLTVPGSYLVQLPQRAQAPPTQIGPPFTSTMLREWGKEGFVFHPLRYTRASISAEQAAAIARHLPHISGRAHLLAVRYVRIISPTNPGDPAFSGRFWIVLFQHGPQIPPLCPAEGCPHKAPLPKVCCPTLVGVDAVSGKAFFVYNPNARSVPPWFGSLSSPRRV